MNVHQFDEVSPLVFTSTVSSNTLTIMVSTTTLANFDWVRDDIDRDDDQVEIQFPDPSGYVMSVFTEGGSEWSRTSTSPYRSYNVVDLPSRGSLVTLAVTIEATNSATGQKTPARRQTIIIKRKIT